MVRISLVVLVDDRMDHDGLSVDGQEGICRYVDPVFSLKRQGFACNKNNIGAPILALHLVLLVIRGLGTCCPLCSRRIVQAGRLIL